MPTPVIIDTDPGVDDVLAILLALASPELEILAIIVSFGNTDIEASYSNILKLYQALSRHLDQYPQEQKYWPNFSLPRKTILAKGAHRPLEGDIHSAQYFHSRDGLGDITNRHPEFNVEKDYSPGRGHPQLQITNESGVDVALELIKSEPSRTITYIALGPLTTLAQVMRKDGGLLNDRIGQIVCMGGALDVPGNTSPSAEFNFFADPYAVHNLLISPSPNTLQLPLDRFLLLPLDITTSHELPFPFYECQIDPSLSSTSKSDGTTSPLVKFTSGFFERTREIMLQFGKDAMELHDIAAVWCAIENPPGAPKLNSGWGVVRRKFEIERIGELTRGMLVVDRRDDPGAYAPGANRSEVQALLEKSQAHPHGLLESVAVPAQVEVEDQSKAGVLATTVGESGDGILVVTRTPGPAVLLKLLAQRVWGVDR